MHFLQGLPIYSFILQTLQSPAAEDAGNFEAAVDALLAVLFNARHNEQQLLANALPVILSLRKKWVRTRTYLTPLYSLYRDYRYCLLNIARSYGRAISSIE